MNTQIKLCECGCGQPAPIARHTNKTFGHIKDQPIRFIHNHHVWVKPFYKIDPTTHCWIWNRGIDKDGYGRIKYRGKAYRAHRHFFETCRGKIPEGLTLDHLCKNRACVNPSHLEKVSPGENARRGSSIKLSFTIADKIRNLYHVGKITQRELGLRFSVHQSIISEIINHKIWSTQIAKERMRESKRFMG